MSGPVLHLLRHGETVAERPWRFLGQRDVALSGLGRAQARWWQERLMGVPFAEVLCSDMVRCRETAEIVAQGRNLPLQTLPGLREINLGAWDGLSKAEVQERFPGQYEARGADLAGFRPPGGESFRDLQDRTWAALEPYLKGQGPLLMVGHAGVNRVLICKALGLPLEHLFRLGQGPGCHNIVAWRSMGPCLVLLNRTPETVPV